MRMAALALAENRKVKDGLEFGRCCRWIYMPTWSAMRHLSATDQDVTVTDSFLSQPMRAPDPEPTVIASSSKGQKALNNAIQFGKNSYKSIVIYINVSAICRVIMNQQVTDKLHALLLTMPIRDWKAALNRFTIQFDDRMQQR